MTLVRFLWYAKWLAPMLLQALIVCFFIYRRLLREFPSFVTYAAFDVIYSLTKFILLFIPHADRYYSFYFYFSWIGRFLEITIGFFVIREIFVHVFRSYDALRE